MADLDNCVRQILCTFSSAALRGIQQLIDGQISVLEAQLVVYETQLLQYDILAIPIEQSKAAAQAIVDEVRKQAFIIPLPSISGCVDLGDFNLNLDQSISVATQIADDIIYEATRLLSYREELNAIKSELEGIIEQFTDIRGVVDYCLSIGG